MNDNNAPMGVKFGRLVEGVCKAGDVAINELARECKLDGPKVLYWMRTGKTPDQILELLRYMRNHLGESWSAFGARIDELFEGEQTNESRSGNRKNPNKSFR